MAAVVLLGPSAYALPQDGGPGDGRGVVRKVIHIIRLLIGVNDDGGMLINPHP
jgi:hypothetical protein